MKPVDPPSGRRAVAIIHDDNLEVVLDMSSPLYQSIRLQERKDSYVWKSLPLTSKLGVPLKFKLLKDGSPGPSSNKSLELLSLECDPESDDFGEPVHLFEEVVLVARQDDMDLLPKQMRAIIAFLDSELLPLVQYGIQKDDIDESGGDSDSAGSPSEQNHEQGTLREDSLQRQESGGDDSAAEEHLEISSTTAQPDVVTKQEAEDALSRINPENFISFFDSHRAEQAKEDITWKLVRCPTESKASCGKCGAEDGADGQALEVCGGCRCVLYCSKECQKADWKEHKAACKRMVWKMTKRQNFKDTFE